MLPAMCGRATLAMLVSSTSMNAARETTTPMSHGLTSGVGLAFSTEFAAALLIAVSFPISLNHQRRTHGEQVNPLLTRPWSLAPMQTVRERDRGFPYAAGEEFRCCEESVRTEARELSFHGIQHSLRWRERRSMWRARNILDFAAPSETPKSFAASFRRSSLL